MKRQKDRRIELSEGKSINNYYNSRGEDFLDILKMVKDRPELYYVTITPMLITDKDYYD